MLIYSLTYGILAASTFRRLGIDGKLVLKRIIIMWAELSSRQWRSVARFWEQSHKGFDEICALLRYYAALSGSSVPTFRDNLSGPSLRVKTYTDFSGQPVGPIFTPEDGTDWLPRNVGTELPLNAA
jgi:hypothetical protein